MNVTKEPVDLNKVDSNIHEIVLDVRYKIKADGIELKNYIIDTGLLFLNKDEELVNEERFIYFETPQGFNGDFTYAENLPKEELLQLNRLTQRTGIYKNNEGEYDKVTKIYRTPPTQFKIYPDELPDDVKYIKIINGLYDGSTTKYTFSNLKQFIVTVVNSGMHIPEIVATYTQKDFFMNEQASVLATISKENGVLTFKPDTFGVIGNMINVKDFYTNGNMVIREG